MAEREWSGGLADGVVFLVDKLRSSGRLGLIVDCGAGEGRHSVYACEKGAAKVIAVEKDPEQVAILRGKAASLRNLEVVEGDVLDVLAALRDGSVDGVIDCGMSHYLTDGRLRGRFAGLVCSKLKSGGLYSISHFSEEETLSEDTYKANLRELKRLYPGGLWAEVLKWQSVSWSRPDGLKHHALRAVLRKL